jgi:hypothetical protein
MAVGEATMIDESLPPSLRTVPNKSMMSMTLEELREEHDYWDRKIAGATGWGAAVGVWSSLRKQAANWIAQRESEASDRGSG